MVKEAFEIIIFGDSRAALSNFVTSVGRAARLSAAGKVQVSSAEVFCATRLLSGAARKVTV